MKGYLLRLGHGGSLKSWVGRTPDHPNTVNAPVSYDVPPAVGSKWRFTDLTRSQAVDTSQVEDVLREGKTIFFTTANSRYKLTEE